MWADLMGSPGSQPKAEGAHNHVTLHVASFPHFSSSLAALSPPKI